jgi:hypothetical protein
MRLRAKIVVALAAVALAGLTMAGSFAVASFAMTMLVQFVTFDMVTFDMLLLVQAFLLIGELLVAIYSWSQGRPHHLNSLVTITVFAVSAIVVAAALTLPPEFAEPFFGPYLPWLALGCAAATGICLYSIASGKLKLPHDPVVDAGQPAQSHWRKARRLKENEQ